MILNFLKIALRNIYKKTTFSVLNILGLTLGLAAFTLIFRYVLFETSYDQFHSNAASVYSLGLINEKETGKNTYYQMPVPLKDALAEIPEITHVGRFNQIDYQNNSIIYDNNGEKKIFEESDMYYAEPDFEHLFDFEISKGGMDKMEEPFKIILSNESAIKLFGDSDPIGKNITLSGNIGAFDYEVVGVMEKHPINSSLRFGALLSYSTRKVVYGANADDNWESWTDMFFVKQEAEADIIMLEDKINKLLTETPAISEREGTWAVEMTSLKDVYLFAENHPMLSKNGNLEIIWILSLVGLFTLIIAYINYINLSTARAMERAKEVGVRKVLGSSIKLLRYQFLSEAFILNIIAFLLGLVIVQWVTPFFQEVSNPLEVTPQNSAIYWLVTCGMLVFGALLSGMYPAFVLASYKPISIVKGNIERKGKGVLFRKGLVIFQYASSIMLLAGAITIQKQISFMHNKDLGVDLNQLIVLNAPPGSLTGNNSEFFTTLDYFKTTLASYPSISSITTASAVPGKEIGWGGNMAKQGAEKMERLSFIACDKDYAKTYGIKVAAGRFYNDNDNTFGTGNVVINEKAALLLGFKTSDDAIGKKLDGGHMFSELIIEGVMKDHHHGSLHEDYEPIAYIKSIWSNYYSIKLTKTENAESASSIKQNLEIIRAEWNKSFEGAPFEYFFASETFDAQYSTDRNFLKVINIFTVLALVIASLGLLGLSSYNMIQRRKEMGIRKILGASVDGLFVMVSKDYLLLLLVAGVIATPLAWVLMDGWLNNYAFRIDIGWWFAVVPLSMILFVAFMTIALQIINTVKANPVESLRQD